MPLQQVVRKLRRQAEEAQQAAADAEARLATKANASTVGGLSTAIASKADASTVQALSTTVASKADTTALATKADVSAVQALSTTLGAKADAYAVTALALSVDTKANKTDVPAAATAAPPPVSMTGDKGSVTRYALENHTHKSNVVWKQVTVSANPPGLAVWVFDTPFATPPYVSATARTPSGASYINVATVQEDVSTTQATIIVGRVSKSVTLPSLLTSLLGSVLTLVGVASADVKVDCVARLST